MRELYNHRHIALEEKNNNTLGMQKSMCVRILGME